MYRKNVSGQYIFFCLASTINGGTVSGASVTVYVTKDGGSQASGSGAVTDLGNGQYSYALTQGETNANDVGVMFTAANCVPVNFTLIPTAADPSDAVHFGLSAIPNATAGASNGLLISGTNSGTTTFGAITCTGAFTISDGIIVTASTTNRDAVKFTGNGNGNGLYALGGSSGLSSGIWGVGYGGGAGLTCTAGSGNTSGIYIAGNGSGNGIHCEGGSSAEGVYFLGGSGGGGKSGLITIGQGTAGNGATFTKTGSGLDISGTLDTVTNVTNAVSLNSSDSPLFSVSTAQAGSATTITLSSGSSSVNDFYTGQTIKLIGNTGSGQTRVISGYVGSTKVATVRTWATNPDSSTIYAIHSTDAPKINSSLEVTVSGLGSFPANFSSLSIDGSGRVDIAKIAGTSQTARDIGSSVLLSSGTGTGEISLSSGTVTVGTNNDKTGYALTQTFPSNFSSFSIDASGRVDIAKIKGTASAGAAGYVGIDWANITAPTTSVNLSGTTIGVLTTYTGNTPQTGDSFARLGAPAGANIAADIAAITSNNPTLQSGTASAGSGNTITIQTALGANDLPNGCVIYISSGTGAYQARVITGYVNSTKVVTVDRNWATNPDNTSVYVIIYNHLPALTTSQKITGVATTDIATTATNLTNAASNGDLTSTMKTSVATAVWGATRSSYVVAGTFGQYAQLSRDGTAQAGAAGTITLDTSASASNSFYNNCLIEIISGTGVSQSRFITAYNGSTKVATVNSNWITNPDSSSIFNIRYFDAIPGATAPTAAQVATAVWQDLTAGSDFSTSSSIGALLKGFTFTTAGYVDANTLKVGGTTQTARDLGTSVLISAGTGTGQLDVTSGVIKANATQILGTAISTPATAGVLDVNVKNINNVTASTPGASGGLLISGSNAGTTTLAALTVSGATTLTGNVSMAAGLNITQSSSNTAALIVTGNGTGNAATFTSGSGATGDGVRMVSAATNGSGLVLTATGTGKDLKTTNTSTDIVLAKTTNITGFNDIAASAIVSSGAITTSGGAVSTVTTVTNLTNAPTVGDLTATMKTSVASAVWDAVRTSYVVANSFGRALQASRDGTAQAGAGTTITLDASANANNSFYNNCLVEIIGGTGIGQARFITGYAGSTKVATVNSSWTTNPDNTSVFVIKYFDQVPGASAPTAAQVATAVWQDTTSSDFTTSGSVGQAVFNFNQYVRRNTAQAGASTTITLDASASATDDIYNYELIEIISGTGVGQGKFITDYVGSTKVATVDSAWATNPDNTSVFLIKFFAQTPGASAPTAAQVATAVWQDITSGDFTVSGSIGKSLFTSGNVPGASGGLFLSGTNSSLTVTGSTTLSDGLIVNRSSSNTSAVVLTGNGSGSAISATGGTTGNAVTLAGGSTSGRGISLTTTNGYGIYVSAFGSLNPGIAVLSDVSDGISVRGGTTGGSALTLLARGGNATGLFAGGNGAGRGIVAQGGTTGIGLLVSGGSTSGDAIMAQTTSGNAVTLDANGTGLDLLLYNQTTNVILEKTTNITGFNDLAATDITSTGGPITLTAGLVESDVKAIDGSASAASKQKSAALAVVTGTVTATSTTTSVVSSDLSSGIANNYLNRVLIIITGAGSYQASTITGFNAGTDTITLEGLQTAPSVGNQFIVV